MKRALRHCVATLIVLVLPAWPVRAARDVVLVEVPDYNWFAGCVGTASGNLMGYWDRHGFPDIYKGPTANGVAPLDSYGANAGIQSLWASQAGMDGRPSNKPGHMDDYYVAYDSPAQDPYITAHRAEHTPDCIGDFIGLSQRRWTNMNNECDGNADAYCFVYWDRRGFIRTNYTPSTQAGTPARDVQSGLRAFAAYRGYQADTFTQLTDFNPTIQAGQGFTFQKLKAEIDAGYPVLLFLQDFTTYSQSRPGWATGNPEIHGMLAFGYSEDPAYGTQWVYYRTSWASGDGPHAQWASGVFEAGMPLRGVIGFHPRPKIRSITPSGGSLRIAWDGPSSQLYDRLGGTTTSLHRYVVEVASSPASTSWTPVTDPSPALTALVTNCCQNFAFYRVRLLPP